MKLDAILERADRRSVINNQREILSKSFNSRTIHSINGGQFVVTPEFISTVESMVKRGDEETILIDRYNQPIPVENLSGFLEEIINLYREAVNQYFFDFEKLRKSRNVKSIMEDS